MYENWLSIVNITINAIALSVASISLGVHLYNREWLSY